MRGSKKKFFWGRVQGVIVLAGGGGDQRPFLVILLHVWECHKFECSGESGSRSAHDWSCIIETLTCFSLIENYITCWLRSYCCKKCWFKKKINYSEYIIQIFFIWKKFWIIYSLAIWTWFFLKTFFYCPKSFLWKNENMMWLKNLYVYNQSRQCKQQY